MASPDDAPSRFLSVSGRPLPPLEFSPSMLGKCRDINDFAKLNRLGEGTYGVVHRSRDAKDASIVALKQVRIFENDRGNGIPITALREISILKSLRHPNVISVLDVAVSTSAPDEIYMVMEYAEQPTWWSRAALARVSYAHKDLANLLDHAKVKFSESEVKCLMKQLLGGLEYLHRRDIIHRDIKMSNLLLTSRGILKLADFGLAREYSERPMTPGVVTVWYRAPELLLSATRYTPAVDLWAAGCIMGELILCAPLLPGDTELQQFSLISQLLGAPSERIWPKMRLLPGLYDPETRRSRPVPRSLAAAEKNMLERRLTGSRRECIALVNELLTYDPDMRPSAARALRHPYFTREEPRACRPEMIQTFPEIRNEPQPQFEDANGRGTGAGAGGGYVFDFGDEGGARKRRKK